MTGPFRISERTHSGLILMTKLAEAYRDGGRVTVKDVASSMMLSEAYLEEVAASLKASGLIQGRTGPKGGYELTRKPGEITAEQIVTALEGPVTFVECQTGAACPVQHACSSKSLWSSLQEKIVRSLRETTLAEIR
jgi:Rrf2 family iron-sulfur cluster assembly transcriptional regulator